MKTKCVCDWDLLPVLIDVETMCCVLRCSRQLVLRMIKDGTIKAQKVGREWRIPKEAIKQYFEVA